MNKNKGSINERLKPTGGQAIDERIKSHDDPRAHQEAIEASRVHGVKSVTEYQGITVALGANDALAADKIRRELGRDYSNLCVGYRNGPYFECAMSSADAVGAKMSMSHSDSMVSSHSPDTFVFRFSEPSQLQSFLDEANHASIELEADALAKQLAQRGFGEYGGITLAKAHDMSRDDAVDAHKVVSSEKHHLLTARCAGEKMEVMVDARSELGQSLMTKYAGNLQSSPQADVAIFKFNSKEEAVAFCNDANTMGRNLDLDARDTFDEAPSFDE